MGQGQFTQLNQEYISRWRIITLRYVYLWISKLTRSLEHFSLEHSLDVRDLILQYFTVYLSKHIYCTEVFPYMFFNVMLSY